VGNTASIKSGTRIKRISLVLAALGMSAFCLGGCGKEEEKVSSISIDKEGKISNVIYEEFNRDYYSADELKVMTENELFGYNTEYDNPKISLEEVEVVEEDESSFAKVSMNYAAASDYAYYNQVTLFYGTVEEAKEAGYKVSTKLVNDNGEKIEASFIDEHADRHIIITSEKTNIKTPFNIQYMTPGVELSGKKEAKLTSATDEYVQLLLSK
jgi:hypothetical protein